MDWNLRAAARVRGAGRGISGLLPVLVLVAVGCTSLPDTSGRAWPFFSREGTAGGAEQKDVLWPVYEEIRGPGDRSEVRFRPVFRRVEAGDRSLVEALWPLVHVASEPGRSSAWVFPVFYRSALTDEEGREHLDWMLFPILAGKEDPDRGNAFLVFPVWGNTKGLLGKDEMEFRFFPLYLKTRSREYVSSHVLWPIVSWGEGGGRRDFRILPFWSHRVEKGKSESTSILWPIVSWGRAGLDTKHPSKNAMVLPFYGETVSDVAWSRFVLFPLYLASGTPSGNRDVNVLWPVFRYRSGPVGPTSLRVWPLFSRTRDGKSRDDWYLWPLIWDSDTVSPKGRLKSTWVVPFYHRSERIAGDGSLRGSDLRVWPLFRRQEAADGSVRFSMLDPIPLRGLDGLFASWDWSWSLVDHRATKTASSTDLLFGLFEHRADPEGTYTGVPLLLEYARRGEASKVQLLKGLLGYESAHGEPSLRLLWLLRIGL